MSRMLKMKKHFFEHCETMNYLKRVGGGGSKFLSIFIIFILINLVIKNRSSIKR